MKLAKGLVVLDVPIFNTSNFVHPTLIYDEQSVILVDTAYPGSLNIIKDTMAKLKVPFSLLNKVILTHQDIDHIGSLSSIVNSNSNVEVFAHEEEKPYIQFEKQPLKMTPEFYIRFGSLINFLPEEQRKEVRYILDHLKTKVDICITDKEELPYCGGIIVIHTPGHTPGHISLYLKKYKTLIAGDALNVSNKELIGPNAQFTHDMKQALNSLKKLKEYDIQTVICNHGGVYKKNPNKRIQEIINTFYE